MPPQEVLLRVSAGDDGSSRTNGPLVCKSYSDNRFSIQLIFLNVSGYCHFSLKSVIFYLFY